MAITKPDLTRIWAGTASPGNIEDPDVTVPGRFSQGWLAEVPTFQNFNSLQKLFTEGLGHINEQGTPIWDNITVYPIGALVKGSDGKIYKAELEQANNDPVNDTTRNWTEHQKAKYNMVPSHDNDPGNALTLGIDENLGRLKRVNYRFGDISVDDTTPLVNLTLDSKVVIPRFRVRIKATGNNFPLTIQTATKLKEDAAGAVVLNTGEIATPIANFKSRGQTFVKITKGTGSGVVDFIYQYQDPKTKERKQALVWTIDLDDGLTPYFYKFLLPECSSSTMNGTYKIGDSTSLNWIIKARVGPVSVVSDGQNLADTPVVNKFLATIQPAILNNNEFISEYYEGHEINHINLKFNQQTGGNISTITDIKIEVDL